MQLHNKTWKEGTTHLLVYGMYNMTTGSINYAGYTLYLHPPPSHTHTHTSNMRFTPPPPTSLQTMFLSRSIAMYTMNYYAITVVCN